MDGQRIRPSLADLADLDLDAPAFPELEPGEPPAVRVVRARPPSVLSTSIPPPIPVIPPSTPEASSSAAAAPAKPKSRFALQREKEAAEKAAGGSGTQRFELDLDGNGGALPRASPRPSLVKDILERPVSRTAPPRAPSAPGPARPSPLNAPSTGFPSSGRGVFPRKSSQPTFPPTFVEPASSEPASPLAPDDTVDGLLASVSQENEGVLRGMSEAQILEEQRQIREEMGLSDGILKMLQERANKRADGRQNLSSTPTPRTRPAPASAPALPQPRQPEPAHEDEDEGSPEYIRRHFFPNEPENPALDWMKPRPPGPGAGTPTEASQLAILSFNLQGALLAETAAFDAAPPLAADHHVSSSSAFTIPSLLSLTASSVPSQRSTAFTVLHRILAHPSKHSEVIGEKEWAALRQQVAQKASWAVRDPNRGVVMACLSLLADLLSSEFAHPPAASPARPSGAEEPTTLLSAFLSTFPLPPLAVQLSLGALPRQSLLQILSILTSVVRLAHPTSPSSPELDSLFETSTLLESLVERFIAAPWPPAPSSADTATPSELNLLALLARSSRQRATQLHQRKLVEPTLRFLAVPPWELEPSQQQLGYALLEETFGLWEVLGRYGIGCALRTQAAALLEGVFERVGETCSTGRVEGEGEKSTSTAWIERFLGLLAVWTTAAVDPHVTEHDIVWSQVEGWRDVAIEVHTWALDAPEGRRALLAKAWELLASWLEGSKVNKSWRGEQERKWIEERLGGEFGEGGKAKEAVVAAMQRLVRGAVVDEDAVRLVAAALGLSNAYTEPTEPPTPQLIQLDQALIKSAVDSVVAQPQASPFASRLLVLLLPHLDLTARLSATADTLPLLHAEDAVAARDLVDWLLAAASSSSNRFLPPFSALHADLELPSLNDLAILRPFLTHAIVTGSGGRVVGPLSPTPRDIKLTASLAPFAPRDPILQPDWPLCVLDELLRSGTSPVFQKLPAGWDASELQLLKTSLALMRLAVEASSVGGRLKAPALVYDLIKVFMLEKDNGGAAAASTSAETDLFRNEAVHHSIGALLAPLSIGNQAAKQVVCSDTRPASETIEGVSSRVSSAPFYQLYTDLVGLYDSISLSDRLFGLVLVPPLSMAYPVDYRRLVWTDYAHVLRTLQFDVGEAIADAEARGGEGALAAYLAPAESNETMLKAYVDALASGTVKVEQSPFLALVAIHHVSQALFGEGEGEGEGVDEKVKARLAKALVGQADRDALRKVVGYEQSGPGEEIKYPPACYAGTEEGWKKRVEKLLALVGEEGRARLAQLL
ncbi:hypothetical protein JCM1840_002838 [Sporobolomyces johnsonii]